MNRLHLLLLVVTLVLFGCASTDSKATPGVTVTVPPAVDEQDYLEGDTPRDFALVHLRGGAISYQQSVFRSKVDADVMIFRRIPSGMCPLGLKPGSTWVSPSPGESYVSRYDHGEFYIGVTEVTRGQWELLCLGKGGSQLLRPWAPLLTGLPGSFPEGTNYPVTGLTHDLVQAVLESFAVQTKRRLDVPTNEEWESAARTTRSGAPVVDQYGWGDNINLTYCRSRAAVAETAATLSLVGTHRPTTMCLFDVTGNASELVTGTSDLLIRLRGGSFATNLVVARLSAHEDVDRIVPHVTSGVRLLIR